MFRTREFDPELFDIEKQRVKKDRLFGSLVYTPHEINKIREYLLEVSNPPEFRKEVDNLLLHTFNFQCRLINANEEESIHLLNDMADILNQHKLLLSTLKPDTPDYKFLNATIKYIYGCIQKALEEVQLYAPERIQAALAKSDFNKS